jgi:hypothetical protein
MSGKGPPQRRLGHNGNIRMADSSCGSGGGSRSSRHLVRRPVVFDGLLGEPIFPANLESVDLLKAGVFNNGLESPFSPKAQAPGAFLRVEGGFGGHREAFEGNLSQT